MPLEIVPVADGDEISPCSPIVGWRVDQERYEAIPLLADGNEGPGDRRAPATRALQGRRIAQTNFLCRMSFKNSSNSGRRFNSWIFPSVVDSRTV